MDRKWPDGANRSPRCSARERIESLFTDESQNDIEDHAFAAGLIAGLSDNVAEHPTARRLITHINCFLKGDDCLSLARLNIRLDQPTPPSIRDAIRKGHEEALHIIRLLARQPGEA